MSLLALMADKFELEPPEEEEEGEDYFVASGGSRRRPVIERDRHDNDDEDDNDDDDDDFATLSLYTVPKHGTAPDIAEDKSGPNRGIDDDTTPPPIGDDNNMSTRQETKLLITFLLMVIVGTANKVFQKLQAIPMYNYPNSLNLLQNFVYVPLCFAYILPVSRYGLLGNAIPAEVTTTAKRPFAVMGFLDCLTCTLLTFAAVYLPGSLLILLPQAAIPISMILSKKIKGESYARYQYWGAAVVVLGILVVLEPLVSGRHNEEDYVCEAYDEEEFCALCEGEGTEGGCLGHRTEGSGGSNSLGGAQGGFFAVVPSWAEGMSVEEQPVVALRSLLAESADNSEEATASSNDNGNLCRWIPSEAAQPSSSGSSSATTTTLLWSIVTIFACVPMTLSSIYKEQALSGSRSNIDPIFLNGWVALFQLLFSFPLSVPAGMSSNPPVMPHELPKNIWDGIRCYLGTGTIDTGCHPDDMCHESPLYVNVFLVFNVCFNILIVYILKFGSANVLFLASTVMVPIGNLAFALPFMPGSMPLKDSDVAGLVVILLGLVTYRFGNGFGCGRLLRRCRTVPPLPWRRGKTRYRRVPGMLNDFEWDAPIYDDENESDASVVPSTSSVLEQPLLPPVQ